MSKEMLNKSSPMRPRGAAWAKLRAVRFRSGPLTAAVAAWLAVSFGDVTFAYQGCCAPGGGGAKGSGKGCCPSPSLTAEAEPEVPFDGTTPPELKPQNGQPVAMFGVCPVTLAESGRAVLGRPLYWSKHEGRTYYCANTGAVVRFMNNPARYVPAASAHCVVMKARDGVDVPGDPRYAEVYNGRLYLFARAEEQALFREHPAEFVGAAGGKATARESGKKSGVSPVAISTEDSKGRSTAIATTSFVGGKTKETEPRRLGLLRRLFGK